MSNIEPNTEPIRLQCRHLFTDGRRCGSPALREEEFCYYHHTSRRPAPRRRYLNSPLNFPALEDHSAIQDSISQILDKLAANEIEPRRAGLMLYGLQIARQNLPKPDPRETPAEPVSEVANDPLHGLIALPAELGADEPMGSAQRLLLELGE